MKNSENNKGPLKKRINMKNSERLRHIEPVIDVILSNPFDSSFYEKAQQLVKREDEDSFFSYRQKVEQKIKSLCEEWVPASYSLQSDQGQDPESFVIKNLLLYNIYLNFKDDFNAHIERELLAPQAPQKLTFGRDIRAAFEAYNFKKQDIAHYIAIFYQLRRAFYFLHHYLAGEGPAVSTLRQHIWNNIFTSRLDLYNTHLFERMADFSLLILGETGTGKSVSAKIIGYSTYIPYNLKHKCFDKNFTQCFHAYNLTEFSEGLIESELFGHKKGAFTGASGDHIGVFGRSCKYDVVFLDEIGELSLSIQVKLLRVLQERVFSQIGGETTCRFDGRLVCATLNSIESLLNANALRHDFYFRLATDSIFVPNLKTRIEENDNELKALIPQIVERVLNAPNVELSDQCLAYVSNELPHYQWPGNIRELEQFVRQFILKQNVTPQAFTADPDYDAFLERVVNNPISIDELQAMYVKKLMEKHQNYQKVGQLIDLDRRTVKKIYIED